MKHSERIAEIESRLKEATPRPWYAHHCFAGTHTECWCKVVGTSSDPTHDDMDNIIAAGSAKSTDSEFIAASPSDIEYLLKVNEKLWDRITDETPNHVYTAIVDELDKLAGET